MNGPDAVREIREKGFTGVILGLTGSVFPDETNEFMDAGCDAVLQKPLNLETFRSVLSGLTHDHYYLTFHIHVLYRNGWIFEDSLVKKNVRHVAYVL